MKAQYKGIKSNTFTGFRNGLKKSLFPGLYKSMGAGNKRGVASKLFVFYTTQTGSFTVTMTKPTGQAIAWNFGDGQEANANSATITYTKAGIKQVVAKFDNPTLVMALTALWNIGIYGVLDLSLFVNSTSFLIYDNPGITKIINPKSNVVVTNYNIRSYTGQEIDLSPLVDLAYFAATNCQNLLFIKFPKSSLMSYVQIRNSNMEILDFRSVVLSTNVELNNSPRLHTVLHSPSSYSINVYYANGCNLTGTLDLSTLAGLGTDIRLYSNPLLTSVKLPANNRTVATFQVYSCAVTSINFLDMPMLTEVNGCAIQIQGNGMSAAQLNQILIDLNTNATGSFTGRSISAAGSNAAPTGAGITAKNALISKGFTVTTN